ncbi:MAG: transporter substrate-binding protein [Frankiales bacterium]|jgi:phospholipid/cholesterol/gamma-HCH transport system substrate-binding protein|nr:transporter substrate-binding protein [Frankiales bacterium]
MTPFREQNKTTIGTVGLLLILLLIAGAFNADKLPIIGGGAIYKAEFSEAAGLRPTDEVRVAGVKVGKVISVDLAGDHVLVRFRIKNADFGTQSRADIRIKTVLGRKFVMLTPDGPGQMSTSDVIPLSRTSSPYDVSAAFQGLASTVDQIDTKQLERSFKTLADTFRDTPDEVKASLTGLSRLSRTIASRDDQLQLLLKRSAVVTQVLSARDQDLTAFMSDSSLILQELRNRRAAINSLLTTTTQLSEQLIALVRENRATLAPALAKLHDVVLVLKANQDNIDRALPRLATFTRVFSNNLGNGRWFDTLVQNLSSPTGFGPGAATGGTR